MMQLSALTLQDYVPGVTYTAGFVAATIVIAKLFKSRNVRQRHGLPLCPLISGR